jgi:DNA-binding response OmpR family regulator
MTKPFHKDELLARILAIEGLAQSVPAAEAASYLGRNRL